MQDIKKSEIRTVVGNETFGKNMALFTDFVRNYDLNDEEILGKYIHTIRVAEISADIAKRRNLNIHTAYAIGILHDYARFDQWSKYHSFKDHETIDHGDEAVRMLFENNEIEKFDVGKDDYALIYLAVKFHNKAEIDQEFIKDMIKNFPENSYSFDEIMDYCKLVRDSDKMDLFNRIGYGDLKMHTDKDGVTPSVLKRIKDHKYVIISEMKTKLDRVLSFIGFLHDLNFVESVEQLNLDVYFDALRTHYGSQLTREDYKMLDEIINETIEYFKNKSNAKEQSF